MKFASVFIIILFFLYSSVSAQRINAYAKVTSISGTTLNLSNVNESYHTFEDNEMVVIMQMQDDVIGGNTNDNANFGDAATIGSAGNYEIRTISSHTESAGVPTSITVTPALGLTYNTGANSSVQIISFRLFSAGNYTTTMNMAAMPWDGNVGGVIAFQVGGTLTLAHSISANGAGFRGGAVSANYYIGGSACYTSPYRSGSSNEAFKGEGIYKATAANYTNARAKILNGGGGGVQINAGGGGGGNFTAGGIGGAGWNSTAAGCSVAAGGYGYGGIALGTYVSGTRIFMGGGGGGGQQNNSVSTAGGNGGGIVLIKAGAITTTGTCSISITANGVAGANTTGGANDGAGGGGAAGSIVLEVPVFTIAAGCPLTVAANGGNGGSIGTSTHAGGGGGAQGVVIYSGTQPTTNVTTTTNNGSAGCNNNSSPCNNLAGAPTGTNNSGIYINTTNSLPVELLHFDAAFITENVVRSHWSTISETNSDYFTVYKSKDGIQWQEQTRVPSAGNSNGIRTYEALDDSPFDGISYYRLKQTDLNGDEKYFNIVALEQNQASDEYSLYPNPANDQVTLHFAEGTDQILITDLQGKLLRSLEIPTHLIHSTLYTDEFPAGIYFIQFKRKEVIEHSEKLILLKD